jgi:hypothetical protein
MQRSITYQEIIKLFFIFFIFIIYESLTSIYFYLPPLFGIVFLLFIELLERDNKLLIIPLVGYLLVYEADKGYLFFSAILFFILSYQLIVVKIKKVIGCEKCLIPLFVLYAYIGFQLFSILISVLVDRTPPELSFVLVYYGLIEIFLMMVLL